VTHPSLLQLSMRADEALSAEQAALVDAHISSCTACQTLLTGIQAEARQLQVAMQLEVPGEARDLVIPKFSAPVSLRGFALANITTALVIWLAQFLWKTLFGELVVNAAGWVTSIYLPDIYSVASATIVYLLEEGTAMLDAYLGFIIVTLIALTTLALWLRHSRNQTGTVCVCVLAFTLGSMVLPPPANALEVRRSKGVVVIPASETIDDTLLVAGDTVLIEGTVTGDVVAAGNVVDISGAVGGNLVTFAETVRVSGDVGGTLFGASSTYSLRASSVGGDLWLGGETIAVDGDVRVNRNATFAGESVSVAAQVGKDLTTFAEDLEVRGDIGGDLEAFGENLMLLGDAHIAGDVRFRGDEEDYFQDGTVQVDGIVEFQEMPERLEKQNKYATVQFYLWQVAQLIAAFIAGLVLFWLVPGMRNLSIGSGLDGLKSAGLGFATLLLAPVSVVLLVVTLIGLPIALIVFVLWVMGIYLAKVVLGAAIGRMLMSESNSMPLTLIAGLAIVSIAVNLPAIGGIINFVLTIVGLGVLLQYVYSLVKKRSGTDGAVA
jgi:cytoskeletal protein CcmA (bactofilin family)